MVRAHAHGAPPDDGSYQPSKEVTRCGHAAAALERHTRLGHSGIVAAGTGRVLTGARHSDRARPYDHPMPVPVRLHKTVGVAVGHVQVGGGAPVVVQSMTMTDTADAAGTARQCIELVEAGSDMVRVTVNLPVAAEAVPEIKQRMLDAGCRAPLIGDFHYNGHLLLTRFPKCAKTLDKYRINPGNVGTGTRRDEQFATICKIAMDHGKPVRIGVNGGSLNQDLVLDRMQENTDRNLGLTSEEVLNECMVLSALQSTTLAREAGLRKDQIVISCKVSRPRDLIAVYRDLARRTDQPLHLGLTEAGMGVKGLVWSASAMGVLLNEGIGDTIRVSLTPRPGGDRREEVYAACELLQALGVRAFAPSVTACPGCGRTTSSTFQELAERTQEYIREQMPDWKRRFEGVENLTLAVMGCVVNGPGESKAANIGISLPGTGEEPHCPVYIDGQHTTTLKGTYEELDKAFRALLDDYVSTHYAKVAGEERE
jgi:(E)-4-hydroxy-3-methylbut-2-enyl-diphosphate synthase